MFLDNITLNLLKVGYVPSQPRKIQISADIKSVIRVREEITSHLEAVSARCQRN